jgi:hypothetical protein
MNNKEINTPIEGVKIEQNVPRVVNGQTDLQSKLRNLLGIYVCMHECVDVNMFKNTYMFIHIYLYINMSTCTPCG